LSKFRHKHQGKKIFFKKLRQRHHALMFLPEISPIQPSSVMFLTEFFLNTHSSDVFGRLLLMLLAEFLTE
jgi:hypothetical protein